TAVSFGLEARAKVGIKVRQPLAGATLKNESLKGKKELLVLISDELNVKVIKFDKNLAEEVVLDTNLTTELKEEGSVREFVRALQDMRKKAGLNPNDKVGITISTNDSGKSVVEKYKKEIQKSAGLSEISFGEVLGEDVVLGEIYIKVKLN
ncbi:MAG: DUF5915 domain-containing protein, partial [Patescibacteria group bacterium]